MGIHPPPMKTVSSLVGLVPESARAGRPRRPNLPRSPTWLRPRLACKIARRESFTACSWCLVGEPERILRQGGANGRPGHFVSLGRCLAIRRKVVKENIVQQFVRLLLSWVVPEHPQVQI